MQFYYTTHFEQNADPKMNVHTILLFKPNELDTCITVPDDPAVDYEDEPVEFPCPHCEKVSRTKKALCNHLRGCHVFFCFPFQRNLANQLRENGFATRAILGLTSGNHGNNIVMTPAIQRTRVRSPKNMW